MEDLGFIQLLLVMLVVWALPIYVVYRSITAVTRVRNPQQDFQREALELLKGIREDLQALRAQVAERE